MKAPSDRARTGTQPFPPPCPCCPGRLLRPRGIDSLEVADSTQALKDVSKSPHVREVDRHDFEQFALEVKTPEQTRRAVLSSSRPSSCLLCSITADGPSSRCLGQATVPCLKLNAQTGTQAPPGRLQRSRVARHRGFARLPAAASSGSRKARDPRAAAATWSPVCVQPTGFFPGFLWFMAVTDLFFFFLSSPCLAHVMSAGKEWLIMPGMYLFYLE